MFWILAAGTLWFWAWYLREIVKQTTWEERKCAIITLTGLACVDLFIGYLLQG